MKKYILFTLLYCLASVMVAQQLASSIGRVSTNFNYLNSDKEELDNLHSVSGFHYTLGYRLTLSEKIFLTASGVYNNYAKEGSDPELDNYYKWNTKYIGLSIAPSFEFLRVKKFRIAAVADISPQFMLSGQQTINNQIFSLKGVEQFDSPFLFLRGGLGVNYCLDDKVGLALNYMYGQGSPFSKSEDGEQLKLKTSTFSLGLLWSFKKCKYCQIQRTNR